MNYVGSISIIDRGDAPAKAIIDKNVRSMAQRVADETKEELNKVMDRVDKIYVSYEMATQTVFDNPRGSPNVEYIEDIKELEEILSDTVKKKKYQQQVTVFVVGFQNVSAQKMQLLQQVNQFFLDNSKGEDEEVVEERLQIDLDEASKQVHESLNTAEELTKRLSDLNQDIIEWLVNYANTKASNKGKKRLEKNLEAAKQDITDLSEKLLKLQTELEEKDEKFQLMSKQLDVKTQEAVRYKTAADVAKKSASDNEAHTTMLHEEIKSRDEKIVELRKKISRMEINLTESQFDTQLVSKRLDNTQAQTKKIHDQEKEKLAKLQEEVENKKIALSEAERVMDKLHKEQLTNLTLTHKQEIEELKNEHQEQLVKLTEQLKLLQEQLAEYETKARESYEENEQLKARVIEMQLREPTRENVDITHLSDTDERLSDGKSIGEISGAEDEASRQFDYYTLSADDKIKPLTDNYKQQCTRPESKASTTAKAAKKPDTLKPSKTPVRSKSPNRLTQKTGKKDGTEVSAQDDGLDPNKAQGDKVNDPSRQASRLSKNLDPVLEGDGAEFPNAFDLHDEASWSAVPPAHVPGRFLQYRQLTVAKVKELEEQLQVTLTKTHRKVNSLKSQFTEHKGKWEAERKILFEQVEQAQKLQTDAEKEADAAITQLEEFINEQEKLEDEEEEKRQEIIKSLSRPGTTRRKKSVQETKPLTPDEKGAARGERLETEHSDQELKNLMQQTDDAKAQEKNARQTGAISAPPAVQPQKYETPREDYESQPVTPKHKRISNQSESTQDHQELASLPKQAFTTPRPSSLKESQEKNVEISRLENPEMDHKNEEEIPLEIFEAGKERLTRQSLRSLHDLKTLSLEDVLTPEQQKAFDKLRTVVRSMSSQRPNRPFDEAQLERTISILSIASQIAAESAQLGGLPGGIFESFDKKDARLVSPKSSLRSTTNSRSKRSHTSGSKLEEKEPLHETAELIVEIKDSKAVTVQEIDEKISKEKSLEREPISGNTEEEVRQSSAKSRASLRNQFKSRLDETKHAVESRRTKSPLITLPAQKSVDDELIIESDDEDLPIPDELKEEALQKEDMMDAGMSPPPDKDVKRQISMASRKSTNLADHPLVQEYLRAYTGIHNFKEAMSRVLIDKDQMSASQLLTELGSLSFDKEDKVIPQISNMTENIYYVLNEISQVINSVIQNDRGPVVSSLMIGMTRDNTQRTILREKSGATDGLPMTQQSQRPERVKSASTDRQQYKDLQDQYEKLQNHMADESKKYEEQQQRNMVAMMEMQDTINHLQRELSALGKQSRRPASESISTAPPQQKESAIMFTRLDSERNAKIMKKAVHEDKLDPNRYKEAVVQMEEYVSLPAQRLSHLVRKYVHYVRMKEIEANVQKSESLNENVFEILDKMEALQSRRAKRWTDRMDVMGMERYPPGQHADGDTGRDRAGEWHLPHQAYVLLQGKGAKGSVLREDQSAIPATPHSVSAARLSQCLCPRTHTHVQCAAR
ncbi:myosin-11-like [Dreissena polymorpha]|uniref:myosin-11-like n=1 Tax=Dreissena polymorpha TaxID=45954 RepID=UPI00226423EF|nr:myosin-11-like [Dreissena polymorpha]